MKQVTIQGRTFDYETCWIPDVHYGDYPVTYFYSGTETVTRKKWYICGPAVEITRPRLAFSIDADSNSTSLSKSWWKEQIEKKIEVLERQEELDRGELC